MRDDPIMSWLHDARTTIVHKADLELKSTAKAVVHTNLDLVQLSTDVSPWLTTEEISLRIASTLPEPFESNKKDLVLSVVRAWIVPGMPGQELLDTMAQAYGFLSDLVKEAHHRAGHSFEHYIHDGDDIRRVKGRLPCMITTEEMRTVRIELATGCILKGRDIPQPLNPEMVEVAKKRYRLPDREPFPEDPLELAAFLLPTAKAILVRDKNHVRIMFLHALDGWSHHVIVARSRTEKYSVMRRIAEEVRKRKADSVVEIAEAWFAPIHGDRLPDDPATAKDREEFLVISATTNTGLHRSYNTPFSRSIFGAVKLGETYIEDSPIPPYLAPLCKVWGLPSVSS
jgi:hypothetical protein